MLNGKHILIVDDEPDLRDVLRDEFEYLSARVSVANNGKEAAAKLEQSKNIDLVLSDIRMPGNSGTELIQKLKSQNANVPPFIFFTGYADVSPEQAFEMGAEAIFQKPFDVLEMTQTMLRLFKPKSERYRSTESYPSHLPMLDITLSSLTEAMEQQLCRIGRGGMFIATAAARNPASKRIRFRVNLGFDTLPWIEGIGIVRWERKDGLPNLPPGYGMEFESLTDSSRMSLGRLPEFISGIPYIPRG